MRLSLATHTLTLKRFALMRFFAFWVALCASFGVAALLPAQPVAAQEQNIATHDAASKQVQTLRNKRDALKTRYNKLTAKIARAKSSGDSAKILGGLRLDTLLAEARGLADRLYTLQTQLKEAEARLEESRRFLLASYDSKISRLDTIINTTNSRAERSKAIADINRLKQSRHAYTKTTPTTPDLNLAALPKLNAKTFQDPDEALAAAAELEDEERKLQDPIEKLAAKIARIERANRLSKKARDFREEGNFFDETATAGRTVVPRGGGPRSASGADRNTDASGSGTVTTNSPPNAERNNQAGGNEDSEGINNAPEEAFGAPTTDSADTDNSTSDPGAFSGGSEAGGGTEPNVGNEVSSPTVVGNPTALPDPSLPVDPFNGGGSVVQGGLDPSELDTNTPRGNETRNQRLKRLKTQKDQLEARARELKRRARALRQHADNM